MKKLRWIIPAVIVAVLIISNPSAKDFENKLAAWGEKAVVEHSDNPEDYGNHEDHFYERGYYGLFSTYKYYEKRYSVAYSPHEDRNGIYLMDVWVTTYIGVFGNTIEVEKHSNYISPVNATPY